MNTEEYSKNLKSSIDEKIEDLKGEIIGIQKLVDKFLFSNDETLNKNAKLNSHYWFKYRSKIDHFMNRLNRHLDEVEEIADIDKN